MPIYEYRCERCGHQFAMLQRLGAGADSVACPRCEGRDVQRLLSAFASSSTTTAPSASTAAPSCGGGGFT